MTYFIIIQVFKKLPFYAKGGPLENYQLRRGTHDGNLGKNNTAYMEYISIKPSYWGATGDWIDIRKVSQLEG
jgi:hypothetical protein